MNLIEKVKSSLKKHGVLETFLRTLYRFRIVSLIHSLDFYIDEFNEKPALNESIIDIEGKRVELRELSREIYSNFSYASDLQPMFWMNEQFERGSRLFAAILNGRVVAETWANLRYADLNFINRPLIALPKAVAYSHGTLTTEPYRAKGIERALKQYKTKKLAKDGIQLIVAALSTDNVGAENWYVEAGSKYWGRISFVKWKDRKFWLKNLTTEGRKWPNLLNEVVAAVNYQRLSSVSGKVFALTYPQLMNQALEHGLALNDLELIKKAYHKSEIMFDGYYRPQGVPNACHSVRTASIVLDQNQSIAAVAASLLHNVYMTGQFQDGRCGGPTDNHRKEIRNATGDEIENLVYEYNQLSWHSADAINIHTRDIGSFSEEKRCVLVMRLADLLEEYLDLGFAYRGNEFYSERIESHTWACFSLAKALGLSWLAKELEGAYQRHLAAKVPVELTTGYCKFYEHPKRKSQKKDTFKKIQSFIMGKANATNRHKIAVFK